MDRHVHRLQWLGDQSELMRTKDFRAFDLVPMTGGARAQQGHGVVFRAKSADSI